jgi:hypothetical protein
MDKEIDIRITEIPIVHHIIKMSDDSDLDTQRVAMSGKTM